MGVVELESVQIEPDRAPGVGRQPIGEIVDQLRLGQRIDVMVEVGTDTADGAGIRVDGLGLQTLEPEVLEVGLVVLLELDVGC